MNRFNRYLIPVFVIVVFLAGFSGYFFGKSELTDLRKENIKLTRTNRQLETELNKKTNKIAVFFIKSTSTRFYLKPLVVKVQTESDMPEAALKALFNGPPAKSELLPVFPKGTQALSIKVNEGLATVNLNKRATEINVGAEGESLAVGAIVNTLTKLPEIYEVQILIEGEAVESLAGHVDLTTTFKYDNRIVKTK